MACALPTQQHRPMAFKILIVDDSAQVRASLIGLLERIAGVDAIDQAASLAQAVLRIQLQPPALVVLDLRLPDGLGCDLIPILKRHEPRIRIAILTFHADDSYRKKCLALGSHWFFDKATQCDDLFEVIQQEAKLNASIGGDRQQDRPQRPFLAPPTPADV